MPTPESSTPTTALALLSAARSQLRQIGTDQPRRTAFLVRGILAVLSGYSMASLDEGQQRVAFPLMDVEPERVASLGMTLLASWLDAASPEVWTRADPTLTPVAEVCAAYLGMEAS